jgi:hypothetical protein
MPKPAAQVWSQDEKLQMTVYTSAPALQFYSGNYLGGTPSRDGQPYADWQVWRWRASSCRIHRNPEWPQPDCVLRPGEEYQPDGISVYCPIIPSPPDGGLFLSFAENSATYRQKHNLCFTSTLH